MKPIYTFLLAFAMLIFTNTSFAQKIRFTDSTNSWFTYLIGAFDPDGGWRTTAYDTEAVILGNTYRRMTGGFPYDFFIREDTSTKKVYYRIASSGDTDEHVLYDYNLNLGDTIQYRNGGLFHTDSVIAIDSMLINGVYHKWFDFKTSVGVYPHAYTVIEGVGCTSHPIFPVSGICFEYFEALICFRQNGVHPTFGIRRNNCWESTTLLNCSTMEIAKANTLETPAAITPNPATTELNITTTSARPANITIYDLTGRCILNTQTTQQNTGINTSSWHNGLYMVIVRDNTGILKREMVVVRQ